VAETLIVSEHTVTNHLCNVYRKFGTRNRVEVLKLAVSKGILPVDELMTYTVQS
jgi:DNA-binding CsgD family transcriptional regulator